LALSGLREVGSLQEATMAPCLEDDTQKIKKFCHALTVTRKRSRRGNVTALVSFLTPFKRPSSQF
jgi:hypothetical protein